VRQNRVVRPFEIRHADPHPVARAAAIRARIERVPAGRGSAADTPADRLRRGFELSRFAARLRDGAR
jgi:hypothetical protein